MPRAVQSEVCPWPSGVCASWWGRRRARSFIKCSLLGLFQALGRAAHPAVVTQDSVASDRVIQVAHPGGSDAGDGLGRAGREVDGYRCKMIFSASVGGNQGRMRGAEGLVLKEVGWAEPQRWHLRQRGGRRGAQGPRHTQGPVRTGTGEARLWPAVRGLVAPLWQSRFLRTPPPALKRCLRPARQQGILRLC